jgi:hypothetical protein
MRFWKHSVVLTLLIILTLTAGCAKQGEKDSHGKVERQAQGVPKEVQPFTFVTVLKEKTFSAFPSKPIGMALDSYSHLPEKEWRETPADNGTTYVDFFGWKKTPFFGGTKGIAATGINIKFAVYKDSTFAVVMVSKVEKRKDGKMYMFPLGKREEILESIYGNREIPL